MSNNTKESNSNINRAEKGEITKEKYTETHLGLRESKNLSLYNPPTSDNTINISESSYQHEDYPKVNKRGVEEYYKNVNLKNIDMEIWKSEFNSSTEDMKTYIDFFSLPRFGISEKSTQTMLTARDIDDLEFMRRDIIMPYPELFRSHRINMEKKALIFTDQRKFELISKDNLKLSELSPLPTELAFLAGSDDSNALKNHFIQIKRSSNDEISRSNKVQLNNDHNTHIHLKSKSRRTNPVKRRTIKDKISPTKLNCNLNSEVKYEFKEILPGKESSLNSKPDDHDEIAGIINNIKNSTKKELKNQDFNISSSYSDALLQNKNKIYTVRKFDAYQFFKAEYASSIKDKTDDELEKICRNEWNNLDKETKKIYNLNAEREKKNHKLKKKNQMKEQLHKKIGDTI